MKSFVGFEEHAKEYTFGTCASKGFAGASFTKPIRLGGTSIHDHFDVNYQAFHASKNQIMLILV